MYVANSNFHRPSRPRRSPGRRRSKAGVVTLVALLLVIGGFVGYRMVGSSPAERAAESLQFNHSVTAAEKQTIQSAIKAQQKTYKGTVTARVETTLTAADTGQVLSAYVPVTNVYAVRQQLAKADLATTKLFVPPGLDTTVRTGLAAALGVSVDELTDLPGKPQDIADTAVAFIPANQLSPDVKLLTFEGAYYLDSFVGGAVFRQARFDGSGATTLSGLQLNKYATKDSTLKVHMTGVTALTRTMITKLGSVKNASYFSEKIGNFLAAADLTHVSNEVSFKSGCGYSIDSFCAPPAMIDALKTSGIDLVELTGNHNNDTGNQYNTETINLYRSLGWHTFGGGLNATDAAKPYIANLKGSKVAFLGYNYADSVGSGAVATASIAGANHFDIDKIKADIVAAKQQAEFVIVDVQFWECQAYPSGFVEFPECDKPIPTQKETFRQLVDLGADMVVGTQAHQPQTYELYKGKPIYYGLGNLYFEQTQWPGTERGIILTHYFVGGKLVQTKLSPTVYDKALQVQLTDNSGATYLLQRLKTARTAAGL